MTISAATSPARSATTTGLTADVERAARRQRLYTLGGICLVVVYLFAALLQFDVQRSLERLSLDRAAIFLLDTYAYKDHATMRWSDAREVEVTYEGSRRMVYDDAPWLVRDATTATTAVLFENGGRVVFHDDRLVLTDWPDVEGEIVFGLDRDGDPTADMASGASLPAWIRVSDNKVEARPSLYERFQIYRSKAEVHRYELGWAYFWFDFDSPLRGMGPLDALGLVLAGERVDPDRGNLDLVVSEFLDNDIWIHGLVLFAMLETIMMALIGTMIASVVGLPLAFAAARNTNALAAVRFALRRLFDFLRSIDFLIWSLVLLRAFGPGLFTGIFAIALTDTGTMGKLMSEAIENADGKQREGVAATGADRVQQYRFGIVPQILPIFISQSLYYLESNTRSAVVIGAMGAGGIGLQFISAIRTGSDWENVAYMSVLVLVVVIAMDTFSGWLRRTLIGEGKA
jgi:phosphonate transport system permease protein